MKVFNVDFGNTYGGNVYLIAANTKEAAIKLAISKADGYESQYFDIGYAKRNSREIKNLQYQGKRARVLIKYSS